MRRRYEVAGYGFELELDAPWRAMEYTPAVVDRIERARRGDAFPGLLPTRAGDPVPRRTFVKSREELPEDMDAFVVDLSQYEPFASTSEKEPEFRFCLKPSVSGLEGCLERLSCTMEDCTLVMKIDSERPFVNVWSTLAGNLMAMEDLAGNVIAYLRMDPDFRTADFYPMAGIKPYGFLVTLSSALMTVYAGRVSLLGDCALFHSSAIAYKDKCNLFLGISGTGKSTHSRLWLEKIEGCHLLNDDNPVVRHLSENELDVLDGMLVCSGGKAAPGFYVFGSPWSGKTPCYRRACAPLGSVVRLSKAPANSISRQSGLSAYASVFTSAFFVRWCPECADHLTRTVEKLVTTCPVYGLGCLPDESAARLCADTINN